MAAAAAVSCPDDVADHQHGAPVGLQERVVPVAADLRGLGRRDVPHRDLHVVGLGRWREQAALQLLGEQPLLLEQPRVVERERGAGGDVARGGDEVVVVLAVGAVEQAEQAHGAAAREHGVDAGGLRGELQEQRARLTGAEHRRDAVGGIAPDHRGLPGADGLGHERGAGERADAQRRVALGDVLQGGVDVRPADVAQAAVVVDQRHEAPVGEVGHEQLREAGDRLLGVQRVGQVGGDVGQQLGAPHGVLHAPLGGAALGDVVEVDAQAVRTGPRAHLVPGVERRRVVGLEGLLLTGRGGAAVVGLEVGPDREGNSSQMSPPSSCSRDVASRRSASPLT
jgi:hypothetical protein